MRYIWRNHLVNIAHFAHYQYFIYGESRFIYLAVSCDFSEINKLSIPSCTKWGSNAHPIDYAVDSDSSTFWLSRAGLDSVDLLFDLRGMFQVSIMSPSVDIFSNMNHSSRSDDI